MSPFPIRRVTPGISFKINLIVLAVVLILGGALGAYFVSDQRRTLEGELERRVLAEGGRLARELSVDLHEGDMDRVRKALQAATLDREIAYLIVKGIDGAPVAGRWAPQVRGSVSEREFPLRAMHPRDPEEADNAVFGLSSGAGHGSVIGTLSVGIDHGPRDARIRALVLRTCLMVAAAAFLANLVGYLFARLLLKRSVEPLLAGIRGFGTDLSRRLDTGNDVEIAEIAAAFNDLADRLSSTLVSKEALASLVEERTALLRDALDEQVRLERQLLQSQKLEAIGVLAGGVAHDFNNLLTPILGYTEMAIEALDEGHPARRNLAVVLDSATRASGLTRQILAFSRKQVLEMRVLELNEEVLAAGRMLKRLIGEDIEVRLDLAADLPPVAADPTQVQQVLLNLAINARDAMPEGGTLTIQTSTAAVDGAAVWLRHELPPGTYAVVSVTDTGTGMDEATRRQIFEPFFTTKGTGKGTGLGLSTVYGIVKQHRGDVTVYSEPGRGTTFRIYLPCADAPGEDAPGLAEAPSRRGNGRILLVEDDEAVREFARQALAGNGYEVTTAPGGTEALAHARAGERFDLLVSDVIMPAMDGRELHRELLGIQPGLRALYISGYPAGSGSLNDLFEGGDPFLPKPFSVRGLLDKVAEAMRAPRPS